MHEIWSLPYHFPDSAISIRILRLLFIAGTHLRLPIRTILCHPSASEIPRIRSGVIIRAAEPLSTSRPTVGMCREVLRPLVLLMRRPLLMHLPTHLASRSSSNNPTHPHRLASTSDLHPEAQQRPVDPPSAGPISDKPQNLALPSTVQPTSNAGPACLEAAVEATPAMSAT